jgi:hypothetical protein
MPVSMSESRKAPAPMPSILWALLFGNFVISSGVMIGLQRSTH